MLALPVPIPEDTEPVRDSLDKQSSFLYELNSIFYIDRLSPRKDLTQVGPWYVPRFCSTHLFRDGSTTTTPGLPLLHGGVGGVTLVTLQTRRILHRGRGRRLGLLRLR